MLTFQDLQSVGGNEDSRGLFCRKAIDEFRSSREYHEAHDGESYYAKHNVTIERYQKFIYTISGHKVEDVFSANYKLKTTFFRRLVIQQVQYLLGNGVVLDETSKKKLGKGFDYQLTVATKRAMAEGKSFLFWNYDHLEVFGYADTPTQAGFCPLYSEETSELMAGIRYWYKRIGKHINCRMTLYEADGITEYYQQDDGTVELYTPKKAYKTVIKSTPAEGVVDEIGENYSQLPIIPLYTNDVHESELVGIRECVDAYDFIKSGLANNIDDADGFYWLVQNAGGMDDRDLAKLVQRMKTVHAAVVDSDDGGAITPTTLNIPVEARSKMLEILRNDIYEDFMALDMKQLSAAQKTTQEIQAAYQSQDNKCDDMEYLIVDSLQRLFAIVGIDEDPTFVRRKVTNEKEQAEMLMSFANYLSDEFIISHLPFVTPEEANEEIIKRQREGLSQFGFDDSAEEEELPAEE